jgi:hypothetical protein
MVAVEYATAGLTFRGQDVEPLHHADILVSEDVAMHDKAPGRNRIEVSPKGNRSWRIIGSRNNQSVMPFRLGNGDTVNLCHQNVILVDMERMVRE